MATFYINYYNLQAAMALAVAAEVATAHGDTKCFMFW